jgi:hypothetical protein
MKTELCELFEKYGADKCPLYRHSYSTGYNNLLKDYRDTYKNVLEIGIGTTQLMQRYMKNDKRYEPGASLRAWRDYFTLANVYGLDIERNVLFEEDRIHCFYTDQSDASQLHQTMTDIRVFADNDSLLFDMILDDGSHIYEHMLLSMQTLDKYVTPGGYYIIEDVQSQQINDLVNSIPDTYEHVHTHYGNDYWDNYIVLRKL